MAAKQLPQMEGFLEVNVGTDAEPDIREVDIYSALEFWRESGVAEDAPKSKMLAVASERAATWFEQTKTRWPSVKAAAFWNLIFEAVSDEKKDESDSNTPS